MLFIIIKSTYQVGLELIEVNVKGSVKPLQKDLLKYISTFSSQFLGISLVRLKTPEFLNINAAQHVFVQPQGGGDGGDNLSDHAVEVGVSWRWDLQVVLAQIIDRLPLICLIFDGKADEASARPGCQRGRRSRSAQGWYACRAQRCTVPPGQLTPESRWWSR